MILPIVFTCDNKYFKYTNVVITSLIENRNSNVYYEIHVLSEDVSEENKRIAQNQISKYKNFSINFHVLDIDTSRFYLNSYMSVSTYYRFYIAEIFPQYDRILYLDSDLIIQNDISIFANIDFEDHIAVAAPSVYIHNKIKEKTDEEYPISYFTDVLKMKNPLMYFNAGVMLCNLKKMRELSIQQLLFNALEEIPKPKLQDQDILNSVFSRNGGVKLVSNKFNYTPVYKITNNRLFFDKFKKKLGLQRENKIWFYIYHYVGKVKPWQYDNGINTSLFFSYAYQSPFFDEIIKENGLNTKSIIKKYKLQIHKFL